MVKTAVIVARSLQLRRFLVHSNICPESGAMERTGECSSGRSECSQLEGLNGSSVTDSRCDTEMSRLRNSSVDLVQLRCRLLTMNDCFWDVEGVE